MPTARMAKELSTVKPDDAKLNFMLFVSKDAAAGSTALRRSRRRAWFEFGVPLPIALVAALSTVAELTGFDDPDNLLLFTWNASPVAVVLVAALLVLLLVSVYKRYTGPRVRSSFRFRLGHRVIAVGKLFPFSKRLQRRFLTLGLSVMTGRRHQL